MDKMLMFIPIVGGLFLILFAVLDPNMIPALLITSIPFIATAVHAHALKKKMIQERDEMAIAVKSEKDGVLNEMKRKDKRQQEHNGYLKDFSRDLVAAVNKDQILMVIVKTFAKMTEGGGAASQCFIMSHDPGTTDFMYETGFNFDRTLLRSERFSENEDILKIVVNSQKIHAFSSDVFGGDSQVRFFVKEDKVSYLAQLGSLALIPLVLEDETWGIIVIFCRENAAAQIKKEEDFFMLLAAQASIALGSAIHRGLASVDRLTQLYNRTFFQKRMLEEMEYCNRQSLPLSILMIDIDHFKSVNDDYGHQEGDVVLKKMAQILNKTIRLTDVCARYGGEEFIVILPGVADSPDEKFAIAERLRRSVELAEFIIAGGKRVPITISVGVGIRHLPEDKDLSIEELIKRADALLYKAKREGRNRVCYPEPAADIKGA